jgi:alpha-L-fucosidase
VTAKKGWKYWFANNAYAEWYANTLRIPGSSTEAYHRRVYGNIPYEGFAPRFEQAAAGWKAGEWATLFGRIGAKYAVMVTKHHDGYLLWPSGYRNPRKDGWQSRRDYVGEFCRAVRAAGLEAGLYYSGGLDWSFEPGPVRDFSDLLVCVPSVPHYAAYCMAHWRELIERYEPSVLWNDIGFPGRANPHDLFAEYYNRIPHGVVNDRWSGMDLGANGSLKRRVLLPLIGWLVMQMVKLGKTTSPSSTHFDFTTPEYAVYKEVPARKWEATRGLGLSFGYNQAEGEEHYLVPEKLVHSFIDIVAKGGNLLINVGPDAGGNIPTPQRNRLEALGDWLAVNGEGIYATQPWRQTEGFTAAGLPLRFTSKNGAVYLFLLGRPNGSDLTIPGVAPKPGSTLRLLGHAEPLSWRQDGADLRVGLPPLAPAFAYTLRFEPA